MSNNLCWKKKKLEKKFEFEQWREVLKGLTSKLNSTFNYLSAACNHSKWQLSRKTERKNFLEGKRRPKDYCALLGFSIDVTNVKASIQELHLNFFALALPKNFLHTATRSGEVEDEGKKRENLYSPRPRLWTRWTKFSSLLCRPLRCGETGSCGIFSPAPKYRFGGAHRRVTRPRKGGKFSRSIPKVKKCCQCLPY